MAQRVQAGLRRRRQTSAGLRMTAMIDVIFLLLTFFVLTAKFKSDESYLNIQMPTPSVQSSAAVSGAVAVKIKPAPNGCRVQVDDSAELLIEMPQLEEGLQAAGLAYLEARGRRSAEFASQVDIYCDELTQWDAVVKVYDVLYRMGARQITFVHTEQ